MNNSVLNFLVALWIAFQCGTHIERNLNEKRRGWAIAYIIVCAVALCVALILAVRWIL